jgi:hypothetical protein
MKPSKIQFALSSLDECRAGEHARCPATHQHEGADQETTLTVCACACHWCFWDRAILTRLRDGAWTWNG